MGTVYKKTVTKPLPRTAELFERKGEPFARWKDAKGKLKTAPVTTGRDGSDRIVITAKTYTAKYRDGSRIIREIPTGCRDETAARAVLQGLEQRADLVRSGLRTATEDAAINFQGIPIAVHFAAYLAHLEAGGASSEHVTGTKRLAERVFTDLNFRALSDINAEAVEKWLVEKSRAKKRMSARTRNSYLQAIRGFCKWCVDHGRLLLNPLAKVPRADENSDRCRQRRALTEIELRTLLMVSRHRPLAEYGRETERREQPTSPRQRKGWSYVPLQLDDLEGATARARERLRDNPALVEQLEWLGRERALIYKTLVLTGLRKGELTSLTVGQVHLDVPCPFLELEAADAKNRQGASLPIRADLAKDLQSWLADRQSREQAIRIRDCQGKGATSGHALAAGEPLFAVPDQLIKILDRDLKLAGIPKQDERGRTVDVHALRHSFGTLLSKGGVTPRTAQAAMRHSRIDLTMNVYTDPKLLDVHGALDALPELSLENPQPASPNAFRATGTTSCAPAQFAPGFAPTTDRTSKPESTVVKMATLSAALDYSDPAGVSPSLSTKKGSLSLADNEPSKRGRRGSNPQPPDRQARRTRDSFQRFSRMIESFYTSSDLVQVIESKCTFCRELRYRPIRKTVNTVLQILDR